MAKLERVTHKIFGDTATATGDNPEIGQFGSAKAGTYIGTTDIETIQALPAYSNGWIDAVTPDNKFPALPEMTGVQKVMSYQTGYLFQEGIAEWDANTVYYTNSYCKHNGNIYYSLTDDNQNNNPSTDKVNWKRYDDDFAKKNDVYTKIEADARYVNTTGDTMTGNLTINQTGGFVSTGNTINVCRNAYCGIDATNPDLNARDLTIPQQTKYGCFCRTIDTNGALVGQFGSAYATDGRFKTTMEADRIINNVNYTAVLNVSVDQQGKDYLEATQGVRSTINNWGMPAIANRINVSGAIGLYTAPANGWVYAEGTSTAAPAALALYTGVGGFYIPAAYNLSPIKIFLPVAKGNQWGLSYTNVNMTMHTFNYCIGEL